MAASQNGSAGRKPWYARRWTWVVAFLLVVGYIGQHNEPDSEELTETAASASLAQASASEASASSASSTKAEAAPAADTAPALPVPVTGAQVTDAVTATAAADLLGTLPVKGRAPMTGYDRALFGPAWTDDVNVDSGHNGCDTRNDILRRDLVDVVLKPGSNGCAVQSGTLHDPYTATVIGFVRGQDSSAVQVDHVVALADAWQKGAQQMSTQQLADFANDPLNLQATDGPTNQAKGAGDAATWLPPNKAYRCTYVSRQVEVKAKYGLWVTAAERDAIASVLGSCGAAVAPTTTQSAPTTTQAPAPATTPPTTQAPLPAVPQTTAQAPAPPAEVYYPNCSAAKAAGAAPLYAGQPGYSLKLDRDKDGVACEK